MASAKSVQVPAVSSLSLKLDQLEEDPANARLTFDPDALQRLADSLRQTGQLQAILVRLMPNGMYRIVDGHRRARAAKLAGFLVNAATFTVGSDDADCAQILGRHDERDDGCVKHCEPHPVWFVWGSDRDCYWDDAVVA